MKPAPIRSIMVIGGAGAPDPACGAGPDHANGCFTTRPLQHLEWDAIPRVPPR